MFTKNKRASKNGFQDAAIFLTQVPESSDAGRVGLRDRLKKNLHYSSDPLPSNFFRKYISYARSIHPVLSIGAKAIIQEFYLNIRKCINGENSSISVTTRQLGSIIRLCEAKARCELREEVTKEDAMVRLFSISP